jgi:hypothetical protein
MQVDGSSCLVASVAARDTWTRCGKKSNADQFANYMAGFEGGAYDANYWPHWGATAAVRLAGRAYHALGQTKSPDDPGDMTGMPDINAGADDGWHFEKNNKNCACDDGAAAGADW